MAVREQTDLSGTDSFIRQARRAQIVDAAIGLLAEVGLAAASTVAVARRAGVSRGLLTHHFRDRDDLLDAVVEQVYRVAREQVAPEVAGAADPQDSLRAFVVGSIGFYARYPDHMAALSAVFSAGRHTAGGPRDARADHRRETDDVTAVLTAGQRSGRFRSFDPELMARSIRALLDVALARVRAGDDPAQLEAELVATVAAMTGVTA